VTIHGLAVPWNVAMDEERKGRRLAFDAGAFTESIRRGAVYLTTNHRYRVAGDRAPVAIQANGSLALEARNDGLYFGARIIGVDWRVALRTAFREDHVRGVSIGWGNDHRLEHYGANVYLVKDVTLIHVSITIGAPGGAHEPAFPQSWARVLDDNAA
jgi:hypothetical protein